MPARKARVEGEAQPKAKVERPSVSFRALVKQFREAHPEKWDAVALCPTQHGVEIIAEALEKA